MGVPAIASGRVTEIFHALWRGRVCEWATLQHKLCCESIDATRSTQVSWISRITIDYLIVATTIISIALPQQNISYLENHQKAQLRNNHKLDQPIVNTNPAKCRSNTVPSLLKSSVILTNYSTTITNPHAVCGSKVKSRQLRTVYSIWITNPHVLLLN